MGYLLSILVSFALLAFAGAMVLAAFLFGSYGTIAMIMFFFMMYLRWEYRWSKFYGK